MYKRSIFLDMLLMRREANELSSEHVHTRKRHIANAEKRSLCPRKIKHRLCKYRTAMILTVSTHQGCVAKRLTQTQPVQSSIERPLLPIIHKSRIWSWRGFQHQRLCCIQVPSVKQPRRQSSPRRPQAHHPLVPNSLHIP